MVEGIILQNLPLINELYGHGFNILDSQISLYYNKFLILKDYLS